MLTILWGPDAAWFAQNASSTSQVFARYEFWLCNGPHVIFAVEELPLDVRWTTPNRMTRDQAGGNGQNGTVMETPPMLRFSVRSRGESWADAGSDPSTRAIT